MILKKTKNLAYGFTLLELMIALFIFTILSTILAGALQSVIKAYTGTELSAERLRKLQSVLLIISRDVEQATFRPVRDTIDKEAPAFVGTARGFSFTHFGRGDALSDARQSSMQRTDYAYHDKALWRGIYTVLDQAPQSQVHRRALLDEVTAVNFEYLDKHRQFHSTWPVETDNQDEPLPRAVKLTLTLANWGKLSQLYVIAAKPKSIQTAPKS